MKEREEKRDAGEIVIQNRFLRWLDNFWYHHKWGIIVAVFFIFTAAVCFSQCSEKATGDITLVFAGGQSLNAEQQQSVIEVFDAISPEKDDGVPLTTLLTSFSVYTEEEMRAASTDEDGKFSPMAFSNFQQVTNDHLSTFRTYLMTGESAIWLVSEYVYELQNMKEQGLVRPLDDPSAVPSYDGYAVRLSDTELYEYYDALKVLPEDTLIVLSQPLVIGSVSDEETYQLYEEMFQAILQFKAP